MVYSERVLEEFFNPQNVGVIKGASGKGKVVSPIDREIMKIYIQVEDGVVVDVFVIVEYKVNIPSVAWDIQEHVKNEIIEMTELKVNAVNINIQGVHIPEEEAAAND